MRVSGPACLPGISGLPGASGTMRSGVLTSSISWRAGGLLHSARRLAQEMQAQEHAVAAVFSLEDEWSADYLKWWQPLDVHLFPIAGPRWFGFAPGLLPCLRSKPRRGPPSRHVDVPVRSCSAMGRILGQASHDLASRHAEPLGPRPIGLQKEGCPDSVRRA
jgi:hypothetical protein